MDTITDTTIDTIIDTTYTTAHFQGEGCKLLLLLYITCNVLVTNPRYLLYTVANLASSLLVSISGDQAGSASFGEGWTSFVISLDDC